MHTDVDKQIDLETIKQMAREAAKKANDHQGARVVGTSTVVITYNTNKKSSQKERHKIRSFFEDNREE